MTATWPKMNRRFPFGKICVLKASTYGGLGSIPVFSCCIFIAVISLSS